MSQAIDMTAPEADMYIQQGDTREFTATIPGTGDLTGVFNLSVYTDDSSTTKVIDLDCPIISAPDREVLVLFVPTHTTGLNPSNSYFYQFRHVSANTTWARGKYIVRRSAT